MCSPKIKKEILKSYEKYEGGKILKLSNLISTKHVTCFPNPNLN